MDQLDNMIKKYDGLKRNVEVAIDSQKATEAVLNKLVDNFSKISAELVKFKETRGKQDPSTVINLTNLASQASKRLPANAGTSRIFFK